MTTVMFAVDDTTIGIPNFTARIKQLVLPSLMILFRVVVFHLFFQRVFEQLPAQHLPFQSQPATLRVIPQNPHLSDAFL